MEARADRGELEPDALGGVTGFVRYPSAFANV